ncbi:MAG: nucleotidyltransferase domain-containing protein [Kiloniellaceae bacterium]
MKKVGPNRGPFKTDEAALEAVVDRLVSALRPEAIYLFGSRARGNPRPESDFDLLVVTRSEDGEAAYDYERVYLPVAGLGVGCDIVPCPKHDFEAEKGARTGLVKRVIREGRLIYERDRTH